MVKILNPDQALAYCAIILSELSLNPTDERSIISSVYIHLDLCGVSMPPIQIDGQLPDELLALIHDHFEQNRNSSMFRSGKLLHHFRRKISKCLNSMSLAKKQSVWLRNPENFDVDVMFSPRVTAEKRLYKRLHRMSDKAVSGIAGRSYTEYLNSVYARIF